MARTRAIQRIRTLLVIAAVGLSTACSHETTLDSEDIQIACTSFQPESESSINDLTRDELSLNAATALQRSIAADRIAEADTRYQPLAEALGIIADAAQTLTEADSANTDSINWDLVKLAQAAAADQCDLLKSQVS